MFSFDVYVGKPNITYVTRNKVSVEGKKVNLICNASNDVDAIHPLQIKWYNSTGKEIQQDTRHIVHNTINDTANGKLQSVLLFDPVNYVDSQVYTCKAFNHPQYCTEAKSTLNVECKASLYLFQFVHLCFCYIRHSYYSTVTTNCQCW